MAAIEELSPAAGPVSTRPPEDEIDDDEDEDVSGPSVWGASEMWIRTEKKKKTESRSSFFSAEPGWVTASPMLTG